MRSSAALPVAMVGSAVLVLVVAAGVSMAGPGGAGGRARRTAFAAWSSAVPGSGASHAAVSMVACSGSTCSVTLAGTGSQAHVLGTTISLVRVDHGRATLRVGNATVTCTPGAEVTAGPLRLTCAAVADGGVTFSAEHDG